MKVILLRDVSGVGQKGTVQEVSDGYALNRLIPQKLAAAATRDALKQHAAGQAHALHEKERHEKEWEEQARLLKDGKVTVRVEANDKGHLYQQLHMSDIVERIKRELGVPVDEKAISTREPIRSLGRAEITVKLGNKKVPLTVFVERKN